MLSSIANLKHYQGQVHLNKVQFCLISERKFKDNKKSIFPTIIIKSDCQTVSILIFTSDLHNIFLTLEINDDRHGLLGYKKTVIGL